MTIEQRLERLTERHDALTQTVELVAAENREAFAKIRGTFETVVDSIKSLERIAAREHRISRLEDEH